MKKISRRNFLLASGVVTVGAALAACGGGSSSSTAASSAAPASSAAAPASAEGKVLNIWCWNDEFQSRFNDYYPEVKEIAADKSTTTLKDGTTVKWTINANENNNYQNKLDEALLNQDSAADDDKIDIFLIEADYALKYVDSDYVLDVKKDIGLTDSDLAGQYQYTKDIVSVDGSQRGTTWQATPGLFAYRRSIAKEVLGTDDPAEVQTYLSDWDKFNDVAAQAAAKGYRVVLTKGGETILDQTIQRFLQSGRFDLRHVTNRSQIHSDDGHQDFFRLSGCLQYGSVTAQNDHTIHIQRNTRCFLLRSICLFFPVRLLDL